jgi:hypothetical protein
MVPWEGEPGVLTEHKGEAGDDHEPERGVCAV